jgi:hypothetical protein
MQDAIQTYVNTVTTGLGTLFLVGLVALAFIGLAYVMVRR